MRSLTCIQQEQFYSLIAALERLPAGQRPMALKARQARGNESSAVISLAALYFALPPEPDRRRDGERIRSFVLEKPIASGGMGVVYRAVQEFSPGVGRQVAVKLIHPALILNEPDGAIAKFHEELNSLVRLEHRSIARIYDGGIYPDPQTGEEIPFLAMELVRGRQLDAYAAANRQRLGVDGLLRLFLRVCDAVEYAHAQGIIHRDLKPANILVDDDGEPRIIDFGLAQACDAAMTGALPDLISGTPAYMSPEQVSRDYGPVTPASDVYALGIMLYELLAGRRPYTVPDCESPSVVARAITESVPRRLGRDCPHCGRDLEAIVARALQKNPADRYRQVAGLRDDIARFLPTQDNGFHLPGTLRTAGIYLLGLTAAVLVVSYLNGSPAAQAGAWLFVSLSVVIFCIVGFLELSRRYVRSLRPLWNSTLVFAMIAGLIGSLVGGSLYAFGPAAETDLAQIERIWHVRLLRFLIFGTVYAFLYGIVFALSAASRRDKSFVMTDWRVAVWLMVAVIGAALLYLSNNITEIPITATFLGNARQGDVRFETFVLTTGLVNALMIGFANWLDLSRTLDGGAFCARLGWALGSLTVTGLGLAALFWGQGLTQSRIDLSFAVLGVIMLIAWNMACYRGFTSHHWLTRRMDNGRLSRRLGRSEWVRRIERVRRRWKEEWFCR